MAQAESQKSKLDELKKSDPDKAKDVITKQKQRKAMEMAMGIKQIDDTALLKKSIKIKEKQKQKSTIAWCVGLYGDVASRVVRDGHRIVASIREMSWCVYWH